MRGKARMIKPEIWTDSKFALLSHPAKLLFIGLWTFSDDRGVCDFDPVEIKIKFFSLDDLTVDDCGGLLDDLIRSGLIRAFEHKGKQYTHVINFLKHQKIRRPYYEFPDPDVCESMPDKRGHVPDNDCHETDKRSVKHGTDQLIKEKIKEEEEEPHAHVGECEGGELQLTPPPDTTPKTKLNESEQKVFDLWLQVQRNGKRFKPTDNQIALIRTAIDRYDVLTSCQAVLGAKMHAWLVEKKKTGLEWSLKIRSSGKNWVDENAALYQISSDRWPDDFPPDRIPEDLRPVIGYDIAERDRRWTYEQRRYDDGGDF